MASVSAERERNERPRRTAHGPWKSHGHARSMSGAEAAEALRGPQEAAVGAERRVCNYRVWVSTMRCVSAGSRKGCHAVIRCNRTSSSCKGYAVLGHPSAAFVPARPNTPPKASKCIQIGIDAHLQPLLDWSAASTFRQSRRRDSFWLPIFSQAAMQGRWSVGWAAKRGGVE